MKINNGKLIKEVGFFRPSFFSFYLTPADEAHRCRNRSTMSWALVNKL